VKFNNIPVEWFPVKAVLYGAKRGIGLNQTKEGGDDIFPKTKRGGKKGHKRKNRGEGQPGKRRTIKNSQN